MIDRMMSAMVLARRGLFIKSPGLRVPHNEVGAAAYGSVSIISMDLGVRSFLPGCGIAAAVPITRTKE
jgi:hypothetical protein